MKSDTSLPFWLEVQLVVILTLIFLQLFPQIEKDMLQPLQASLDHYEQLKLMEDMLKEDAQTRKVRTRLHHQPLIYFVILDEMHNTRNKFRYFNSCLAPLWFSTDF